MIAAQVVEIPLLNTMPMNGDWQEALAAAPERLEVPCWLMPAACQPGQCFALRLAPDQVAPFGLSTTAVVLYYLEANPTPGSLVVVWTSRGLRFGYYLPTIEGPMLLAPQATLAQPLPPEARVIGQALTAIVDLQSEDSW